MVKLSLLLRAHLENITEFKPMDAQQYDWTFKIKCNSCQEVDSNWITINPSNISSMSGSRGEANLVMRCKFCKREGSASIVGGVHALLDTDTWTRVVELECRGLEPVDFSPRGEFHAKSTQSTTTFDSIELEDDEWMDYDEKGAVPVVVKDIECQFKKS